MTKLHLLILFSGLALLACKKNKTAPASGSVATAPVQTKIDTIKPLPYLPAYPGSYWKYNNGTTITTAATYQKDSYSVTSNSYPPSTSSIYHSGFFYVPVYNGMCLWGYRQHNEGAIQSNSTGVPNQPLVRVISDSIRVGGGWLTSSSNHIATYCTIIAKDTTIIISGKNYYPTIVLYTYRRNMLNGYSISSQARVYYTRDIGLVKTEWLDDNTGAVTGEIHLVDYFINK